MLNHLKAITCEVERELRVYQLIVQDARTPLLAKALLGLALGYLLMPFDLIPDFVPILGQLDDVLIVPGLVLLALKLVPQELVEECRARARAESASS
jgi:uncharacterized membrane protein YkvA (DUF1232 family)